MVVTGFAATRTHKLTPGQKEANRVLAVGRAPVEHSFAHHKNWRILTKLRTDPAHAAQLLRALLVLTHLEVNRSDNNACSSRRHHLRQSFRPLAKNPERGFDLLEHGNGSEGTRACAHGASTTTQGSSQGKNSPARASRLRRSGATWR
ncbi:MULTISPECIES: transposase family protein [unclassified Streptomyces]|uniref:transposase family protein n=1 Tax=unclassified Streptomyces TaxID=2593676 RepID=UPI002277326E|nr:transposase family protein [Streptomyces sp. HmicA12]